MSKKTLIAVNESFIEASRTAWNYYVNSNYRNPKVDYFDTNIETAKLDAQKMVEEYKECIYDLVFAYVNKDDDFPHGFEIKTLKYAIKLSEEAKEFLDNEYFIQNYLGGV